MMKNTIKNSGKVRNKLIVLFLLFATFGFCKNKVEHVFVYKEIIDNKNHYYVVEKIRMENNIKYVKSFYCKDDRVFYMLLRKYRVTKDTLFLCASKDDNIGEVYMIKDENNVIETKTISLGIPCETRYMGEVHNGDTTLFKYQLKENVIDGSDSYYYYDSSFELVKMENDEHSFIHMERIRIDSIPSSIMTIVDSISSANM